MSALSPENSESCKNCGAGLSGEYCTACGQKKFDRDDLTLKEFGKEAADEIFNYDSKLLITLKYLILKPGKLTVDYLEGKQRRYIGPVRLYLIIIAVNFLVRDFDTSSPMNVEYLNSFAKIEWAQNILSAKLAASGKTTAEFYHSFNADVIQTLSFSLYFLIFIFALILKAYFFRSGRYYAEHLIFCLHFMSFGFLRDSAFLPLNYINPDISTIISIITTTLYFFIALKPVYGSTGWKRWINTLFLYGLFFTLFGLTITFSIVYNLIF
jgi:hypothetical protein